jgi:protein SCO1/2
MMRVPQVRIAAAVVLLSSAIVCTAGAPELKSGVFDPPRMAPDFSLRGSDGGEVKLMHYRDKVVALGFGYTSCPDVCPTTLAQLAEVRKRLGPLAKEFQVVYVTVDPERDSVAQLKNYLDSFDPTFIGATGTQQQLAEVRKEYGISAEKVPVQGGGAYFIHHSSFIYLVDREGRLRAMSPYGRSVDDVVSDVKVLLKK